jgi:hypothetical protein
MAVKENLEDHSLGVDKSKKRKRKDKNEDAFEKKIKVEDAEDTQEKKIKLEVAEDTCEIKKERKKKKKKVKLGEFSVQQIKTEAFIETNSPVDDPETPEVKKKKAKKTKETEKENDIVESQDETISSEGKRKKKKKSSKKNEEDEGGAKSKAKFSLSLSTATPSLDAVIKGSCITQGVNCVPGMLLNAVLRIHDILVWIRIRGSMPLTNGSGSCYFHHWPSRRQQKIIFQR